MPGSSEIAVKSEQRFRRVGGLDIQGTGCENWGKTNCQPFVAAYVCPWWSKIFRRKHIWYMTLVHNIWGWLVAYSLVRNAGFGKTTMVKHLSFGGLIHSFSWPQSIWGVKYIRHMHVNCQSNNPKMPSHSCLQPGFIFPVFTYSLFHHVAAWVCLQVQ